MSMILQQADLWDQLEAEDSEPGDRWEQEQLDLIRRWMALGLTEEQAVNQCSDYVYPDDIGAAEQSGQILVNGKWIYRDQEKRELLSWAKDLASDLSREQRAMLIEACRGQL